jgi:xylan 1,4-beta-xylosidase
VSGFQNPVIPGFHPDPSVCRWGDGYVLATSSFTYFPGVPIFHSTDLVNWVQIGNALDRTTQLDLTNTFGWPGLGVFAPTVRSHEGRLWLIVTITRAAPTDSFSTYLLTTDDPSGPWSDPIEIDSPFIDPDLAWDEDGRCFVHTAGIYRFEIDPSSGRVLNGPEPTWSGIGLQHPEAPHLFRREGWWYLLIAEGGTERGHAVSVARSASPTGPWESCPANPILSHRSTDLPVQNTGHADLVEDEQGQWWMVLLGVRPRGATPLFHVLGRETFLTAVDWIDGWPIPRKVELETDYGPSRSSAGVAERSIDDFDSEVLAPQWVSLRVPLEGRANLDERRGWLTFHAPDADLDSPFPTFLARRQQHHHCRATALVDRGTATEAGLSVFMDERHHYEVALIEGQVIVRARIGELSSVVARHPASPGPHTLRIETQDDYGGPFGPGPDRISLQIETSDGSFTQLAALDGRYLSTEVTGGFSGRVLGVYSIGGMSHVDWFELSPSPPSA